MAITAQIIAYLCLAFSLISFIKSPLGIIRIFDFPRMQIAIISALSLVVLVFFAADHPLAISAAFLAVLIQLGHIGRFTPLWRRRSADFKGDRTAATTMRIITCNVKQGNQSYQQLMDVITAGDPDIAVFIETNDHWVSALSALADHGYQHTLSYPLANTYGMHLASKFPLGAHQIRFLLNPEVPSFDVHIRHPKGPTFRLITIHPEPPLMHRDTIGRDAEIAFVANLVRTDDFPVIVTGDLNDVAWSSTTRRFLRVSRLLDPREGRGQFNTFDARIPFLRWPLDHIFHSPHFQLITMRRLGFVGSDHFPMFYELALTEQETTRRDLDAAKPEDLTETEALIKEETARDNRPAGHDWED